MRFLCVTDSCDRFVRPAADLCGRFVRPICATDLCAHGWQGCLKCLIIRSVLSLTRWADFWLGRAQAPPGSPLRLAGQHRVPFGERPRTEGALAGRDTPPRTLSPIKKRAQQSKQQLEEAERGEEGGGEEEKGQGGSPSLSGSEYERAFGIQPWSEHSGSSGGGGGGSEHGDEDKPANLTVGAAQQQQQQHRQSLSPRPVTADSFLRRETPKSLQDGPQWTRAADFIVNETVAQSLKHSLVKAAAEEDDSRRRQLLPQMTQQQRPRTVGDGQTASNGRHAGLAPRPSTVGGSSVVGSSPTRGGRGSAAARGAGGGGGSGGKDTRRRRSRKQRPLRGLTRWQQGQSKGVAVAVGAGRSAVYDMSF
jgi:hypothetical protein